MPGFLASHVWLLEGAPKKKRAEPFLFIHDKKKQVTYSTWTDRISTQRFTGYRSCTEHLRHIQTSRHVSRSSTNAVCPLSQISQMELQKKTYISAVVGSSSFTRNQVWFCHCLNGDMARCGNPRARTVRERNRFERFFDPIGWREHLQEPY